MRYVVCMRGSTVLGLSWGLAFLAALLRVAQHWGSTVQPWSTLLGCPISVLPAMSLQIVLENAEAGGDTLAALQCCQVWRMQTVYGKSLGWTLLGFPYSAH